MWLELPLKRDLGFTNDDPSDDAYGDVGSQLVRRLLQAGERPVVLARDPAHLDREVASSVDARQGDLTDEVFLAASLRGVDALYLVIPDVVNAPDPEDDAEALADSVIAAIEGAGVARAVLQSSAGADRRTGVGFISALGRIERSLDDLVARSGVAVCHPRCGYLFSYLLMGTHEQRG